MTAQKIWFITGASRGFGRIWAEAALQRGDKVAATARTVDVLSGLKAKFGDAVLPLALDVTDRRAVFATVKKAHRHFGRLDVVLSNAGYGAFGAIEETTDDEARANFETNFFGTLSVVQAALPLLRAQRSGHILLVTSLGGLVVYPIAGIYQATKFAVEALGETLAQEVADFGIKVTLVEPGPYETGFASSIRLAQPMPEYAPLKARFEAAWTPDMFGDPQATPGALFRVVDADDPPTHFILGTSGSLVEQHYANRLQTWKRWEAVSREAQGH